MGKTTGLGLLAFFVVLLGLMALHLPFVMSDGEASLGFSRGPFTDEGLYTAQVRNAMRTGTLDLAESDGVIKEPLFSLFAWGVLSTFGDSLWVMRLAMLGLSTGLLAVLVAGGSPFSRAVLVGVPVLALSYYPFHYGHLALVEVTASLLIIGALWGVHRRLTGGGAWTQVLSAGLIFLAYGMKVQFIYAAVIPPVALVLAWGMNASVGLRAGRRAVVDVVGAGLAAVGWAAVYALGWYVPNRSLMSFVLGAQAARRASSPGQLVGSVRDNVQMLVMDRRVWAVYLVALAGLVVTVVVWRTLRRRQCEGAGRGEDVGVGVGVGVGGSSGGRGRGRAYVDVGGGRVEQDVWTAWVALMAPPAAWVVIELHKLTLSYLPSRYFLPLIMALGLFGAAGLYAGWKWMGVAAGHGRRWWGVYPMAGVLMLALVMDARDYRHAYERRAYAIRDMQTMLASEGRWENRLVMGPWAATLFWGTGAMTKPVWKDYFNDGARIRELRPVALVSEPDQEDSERAFEASGVVLREPPLRSVKVRDWTVNVYGPPGP